MRDDELEDLTDLGSSAARKDAEVEVGAEKQSSLKKGSAEDPAAAGTFCAGVKTIVGMVQWCYVLYDT
jgi:hypothetical protein